MRIAVACCAKMEEQYIREFLSYYHDIGIDHVYIADNNDSSYRINLDNVIKDFIDSGFVSVSDYHDQQRIQCKFYQEIYRNFGSLYDWMLFVDIDEYLYINNGISLKEYLSQQIFDGFNSIVFPWVIYDDNDLIVNDHTDLNKRFTRISSNQDKTQVKSIYRTNLDIIPSIHYGHSGIKDNIKICNPNGQHDPLERKVHGNKEYFFYNKINGYPPDTYIKHFQFKTIDEYIHKKILAGRPCVNQRNFWLERWSDRQIMNRFFKYNRRTDEKEDLGIRLLKEIRNK